MIDDAQNVAPGLPRDVAPRYGAGRPHAGPLGQARGPHRPAARRLAYFPEALPEELLYSLLARYRRHVGLPATRQVDVQLHGQVKQHPTLALPIHLAAVAARIPECRGLTVSRLIDRHTLFPYFAALRPPEARLAAAEGMAGDDAKVHTRLGVGHSLPLLRRLRFCPECLGRMVADHGELYWRRDHQLPSVLVCPVHRCDLRESAVEVGPGSRTLTAATPAACAGDAPSVLPQVSAAALDGLHAIALDAVALLHYRRPLGASREEVRGSYVAAMGHKGLVLADDRIDWSRLREAATASLAHLRPIWPGLFDQYGECGRWLKHVSYRKRHNQDPILHLLGWRIIVALPDAPAPFGTGPWPCLGPGTGHVGEPTIGDVAIRRDEGRIVGRFACTCGHGYTRKICSDGSVSAPRLQMHGEVFRGLLVRAARESWSASKIARMAGSDARKVRAAARRLGVDLDTDTPTRTGNGIDEAGASDRG